MKTYTTRALLTALGLAAAVGAFAQVMSKEDYKATEQTIAGDFKNSRDACDSLAGNAKDICVEQAKANRGVAKAELEAAYKPGTKTTYEARLAKANATYRVAVEKCDDLAGNPKDVCVKQAKADKVNAKANARAQMKITQANAAAGEKINDANNKANAQSVDAHADAQKDKREAAYALAKTQCEALAGSARDQCTADAKNRYSQN